MRGTGLAMYQKLIDEAVTNGVKRQEVENELNDAISSSPVSESTKKAIRDSVMRYLDSKIPVSQTSVGGTTWYKVPTGLGSPNNSIYFLDKNVGYAVGWNGTISKTTNGGNNWGIPTSGVSGYPEFLDVFFLDVNTGYVTGINGYILKTTNGGNTWSNQIISGNPYLPNIFFSDTNSGYLHRQYM